MGEIELIGTAFYLQKASVSYMTPVAARHCQVFCMLSGGVLVWDFWYREGEGCLSFGGDFLCLFCWGFLAFIRKGGAWSLRTVDIK